MRSLSIMTVLLSVSAACSNQFAGPAPPPPWADTKPAAAVPARPTPDAGPLPNPNTTSVYLPTTNPGSVTLNQFSPPLTIPVSR
jgi:hypothetical protein